jgi:hypothetical protein
MRVTAALAFALLLLPVTAFGQTSAPLLPGSIEFTAVGGASIPFGDFNTYAEPGFGVGAQASYYVMPALALGAGITYNSYGINENLKAQDPDMSATIWEFTANAKYIMTNTPLAPYAKATVGLFSSKIESMGSSDSFNDPGIGGGLGAQMRLPTGNVGFFAEGLVMAAFTEETSTYYTIRGGINLYVSPIP